jgi:outer membrane lipoprotein SlyB
VGLIDDGNVDFDRTTICTGNGSATQSITMPTFALAEPMQIEVSSQGSCIASMGSCSLGKINIFYNGSAIGFSLPSTYSNQTKCLGERWFGASSPLIVRHGSRTSPCNTSVSLYTASVDHIQIKTNSACPVPRSVLNADFEALANWVGSGDGTVGFVAGAGVGSSKGYRLDAAAGACTNVAVRGDASLSFVDRAAMALSLNGTAGKNLIIREYKGASWVEYVAPSTTYATQTFCIPQYAKGMVMPIEFYSYNLPNGGVCADGDARTFNLDNVSLTTSSNCPVDTSLIDPGFELSTGVINYWPLSLNLNGHDGSVSAAIVNDSANSHSGTHALQLMTQQSCTSATAQAVLSVPPSTTGAGPALKFYYKGGSTDGPITVATGATTTNLTTQSAYTLRTICLDPAAAGEGLTLTLRLLGNGGDCLNTFAQTLAYFDDFQVTTDASCPVK